MAEITKGKPSASGAIDPESGQRLRSTKEELLSCCTNVKAVRLFLAWARATGVVDVDALLEHYPVRTGGSRRWVSRLDDGTLLSLKPHG